MTTPPGWSTHQLGEFLAAVSACQTAASAALEAVERAAEALDAEVAAIVADGHVVASVGFPAGAAPAGALHALASGRNREIAVPGVGPCPAVAVPLDHPAGASLVVARSGAPGLDSEDVGVLHGMARATSLTLRMLGLLDDEAALRRVATLVARGLPQEVIFDAVADEVSRLAGAELVQMFRYEPDGSARQVGAAGPGAAAELARQPNIASAVAAPIVVDGRRWGAVVASSSGPEPMAPGTEQRIAGFTELVATAVSNAQARAELAASRSRVVAAADEMRRRIERNLHDGAQQRLVTLALKLRTIHDELPPELEAVRGGLSAIEDGLAGLLSELREISRGLHPPTLSEYGLGPAVRSLARRAALPVELDVRLAERLPEPVEVAAYYVVSEALTNAAKHSGASGAEVVLAVQDDRLVVTIRDDGAGGADPTGSGLIGLRDRVEALGGTMLVTSPPRSGTTLRAELPCRIPASGNAESRPA